MMSVYTFKYAIVGDIMSGQVLFQTIKNKFLKMTAPSLLK